MTSYPKKEHEVEPITHKELEEALEKQELRIEKYFDAKLAPLVETLKFHKTTLFGRKGSNGIVGAVKILNWGYGLGAAGLGAMMTKIFIL